MPRLLYVVVKHSPLTKFKVLKIPIATQKQYLRTFKLLKCHFYVPSIGCLFFLTRQNAAYQKTNRRLVCLKSHHSKFIATSQNIILTSPLKFSNVTFYTTIRV